jgi:hypothetical protein
LCIAAPADKGGETCLKFSARKEKEKQKMFITVLCRKNSTLSERANGDWASFVAHSKAVAIDRAMEANDRWGGKYAIYVGELTQIVKPFRKYLLRGV